MLLDASEEMDQNTDKADLVGEEGRCKGRTPAAHLSGSGEASKSSAKMSLILSGKVAFLEREMEMERSVGSWGVHSLIGYTAENTHTGVKN